MNRTKCHFCGLEGPEREDPFEAAEAASLELGFHRLDIPFRPEEKKQGGRVRFLCRNCSTHVRMHFSITGSTPAAETAPLKPDDVLVPLDEDAAFEKDTEW